MTHDPRLLVLAVADLVAVAFVYAILGWRVFAIALLSYVAGARAVLVALDCSARRPKDDL